MSSNNTSRALWIAAAMLIGAAAMAQTSQLRKIPDKAALKTAHNKYRAVFEVVDDKLVGKELRSQEAGRLGVACWNRQTTLFPLSYRKLIVQFNIMGGRSLAGSFDGAGTNDVKRKGYRMSIAQYRAAGEPKVRNPKRVVTRRRGTLDWTLVHEMGHYICLRMNAIELFSQSFDGDHVPQPERRKKPDDYPKDGSPKLDGDFVTSYAERTPGDEEVVETFTTYMLVEELPTNRSLIAKKIRFFETIPGLPELRQRIQSVGRRRSSKR